MTVLSRLPGLKFLDSSPITAQERSDAAELQRRLKRPDPSEYTKKVDNQHVERGLDQINTSDDDDGMLDIQSTLTLICSGKVAYGQSKYIYYGRHSEGNRFILDKHL